MQRQFVLFTTLVAAALASGCSRSSADRAPASHDPEPVASTTGERAYTVTGVALDPQIMSGCGIAEVQTFFEHDSAEVDPPKDTVLYQVAQCLSTGKLAGRKVRVVGHTDPRGNDRYNDELGKSRAQAVREYLVFHGVKHDQVEFLSMGEAGADEKSPAEWPYDRRVDVRLTP